MRAIHSAATSSTAVAENAVVAKRRVATAWRHLTRWRNSILYRVMQKCKPAFRMIILLLVWCGIFYYHSIAKVTVQCATLETLKTIIAKIALYSLKLLILADYFYWPPCKSRPCDDKMKMIFLCSSFVLTLYELNHSDQANRYNRYKVIDPLITSLHTLATFHHWCWLGAKRVQHSKSCLIEVLCSIYCYTVYTGLVQASLLCGALSLWARPTVIGFFFLF